MNLFEMSLSASVLIVAIVVIRSVALHKLPKRTFLALWGIAVLRLLIPVTIPSRFSVYTAVDMLAKLYTKTALVPSPAGASRLAANIMQMTGAGELAGDRTPMISISPPEIVWMVGMGVCALFFLVSYLKCYGEFKMSLPINCDVAASWLQGHPLRRDVQIRHSDRIKTPLTYGIFRPVILLPKAMGWVDEKSLGYVLTHEYIHIRRFDTLLKLVLAAAVCIHWFNPCVWVLYVLANRDIELSCDETTVKALGENSKSDYALTLIGFEEKKGMRSALVSHFSKNAIEERVVSIMKIRKTSLVGILLALALVLSTTTAFATSAVTNHGNKQPLEPSSEFVTEDSGGGKSHSSLLASNSAVSLADNEVLDMVSRQNQEEIAAYEEGIPALVATGEVSQDVAQTNLEKLRELIAGGQPNWGDIAPLMVLESTEQNEGYQLYSVFLNDGSGKYYYHFTYRVCTR